MLISDKHAHSDSQASPLKFCFVQIVQSAVENLNCLEVPSLMCPSPFLEVRYVTYNQAILNPTIPGRGKKIENANQKYFNFHH